MQQLYRIATWLARRRTAAGTARQEPQRRAWGGDPLSHPALSRMTPHELADLPLERALFRDEAVAERCAAVILPLRRTAGPCAPSQGC